MGQWRTVPVSSADGIYHGLGSTPSSWRTEEPDGVAAGVHIDPQFFAALEKTLSDIDEQADHDQLKYRQQGGDEPTPHVDERTHPRQTRRDGGIGHRAARPSGGESEWTNP